MRFISHIIRAVFKLYGFQQTNMLILHNGFTWASSPGRWDCDGTICKKIMVLVSELLQSTFNQLVHEDITSGYQQGIPWVLWLWCETSGIRFVTVHLWMFDWILVGEFGGYWSPTSPQLACRERVLLRSDVNMRSVYNYNVLYQDDQCCLFYLLSVVVR